MAHTIYVSRAGLTRCPACTAHIRVAPEVRETSCGFCGAQLERALGASPTGTGPLTSSVSRLARAGRSGLMAASLFGLATVGTLGCAEEDEPTGDATMDVSETSGDATSTATGMDVTTVDDTAQNTSIALYGVPADVTEVDAASDTVNVALYGIVPGDATDSMDVQDAADTAVEALYGAVPADLSDDAG